MECRDTRNPHERSRSVPCPRHAESRPRPGCAPARWLDRDRRRGSHRVLVKDDRRRVWAYHEGVESGGPAMARVAKDYGYTLAELRKLSDDDQMSTRLRAEFLFDAEANNWNYR